MYLTVYRKYGHSVLCIMHQDGCRLPTMDDGDALEMVQYSPVVTIETLARAQFTLGCNHPKQQVSAIFVME
jgi:hypothetical protein